MRHDLDDVDWTSFTGRKLPLLDPASFVPLARQTVLITGAGGSIGSALAETVAAFEPEHLILLDHSEAGLSELQRSFSPGRGHRSVRFVLGDLRDRALLRDLFRTRPVHILFHAAACKHVPLLEENPFTAVSVNALGTGTLINTAHEAGVEQLVLLSTDKAVEPVSILGVTKRIAEMIALAADAHGPKTKVLRLCNVLGSAGSVAPVFAKQIRQGGPITITDSWARRYFITVEEAVAHLLHVSLLDATPSLWVPRVDEQQSIKSLAIFLRSTLEGEAALTYTGLRAGDKLTEKLWSEEEAPVTGSRDTLIRLQTPVLPKDQLDLRLAQLGAALDARSASDLLHALQALVPGYRPSDRVLAMAGTSREGVLA